MLKRYLLPFLLLSLLGLARCGGSTDLEIVKGPARGSGGSGGHAAVGAEAGQSGAGESAGESARAGEGPGAAGNGQQASGGSGGGASVGEAGSSGGVQAQLLAVEITPSAASVAVGTAAKLAATARYADGSTADVSAQTTWSSSAPSVATVAAGRVTALVAGTTTVSAALAGKTGSALITVPQATVVSLAVTPATASVGIRGNVAFQAVVTLTDGTTEDVTATATWSSSDTSLATVAGGVATGVAAGSATLRASAGSQTGSATLTVTAATLASIAVTPANATVGLGASLTFQATGTFSDGSVSDVSASATWVSSDSAVATLDAKTHAATGVLAGSTQIQATVGSVSGQSALSVTAAALVGITLQPAANTIAVGGTVTLGATGMYADGTSTDLTHSVTWTSAAVGVASVSNASGSPGLVQGLSAGSSVITATFAGQSGTANVTVTAAKLVSIAVAPQNPTLPLATSVSFTATGSYADGSQVDVTGSVTWSTGDSGVATISNAAGGQGALRALTAGTTQVTATLAGVQGSTTLTVTAATLVSIAVTPASVTLNPGANRGMTATGTYSDNTTADLTTSVVWSSSANAVATISNAQGSQGTLSAVAAGTATVAATFQGVAGSTDVTVASATLSQLVLDPIATTVRVGQTVRYTAVAIFSDNSQRDVTGQATWSSSDTAVATLARGNGPGGGGGGATATAAAVGTTTISATYQGVTGTTTLTVTSATLAELVVTPINPTLPVGRTVQLVATAIYSDNTSQAVTGQATWQSSGSSVAAVATGGGGPGGPGGGGGGAGVVSALAAGSVTVSATWNGVSGTTTITVTSATIASITVTPAVASLAVGAEQQFSAQAIYSDDTSVDVTQAATWISSDATVGGVSDAGGPGGGKGLTKALAAGTATVSASYGGVTGSAKLTVTSATLVEVDLTPVAPSVAAGTAVQFAATALYSDDTSRSVTADATWTSSNPAVAAVSTAAGSRGQTQTLQSGSATINATFAGVTGSTTLHVTLATLVSIDVTPFQPTFLVGIPLRLVATGIYSDFSTVDLTGSATWTSSASSVVSVSNANATRGQASPLAAGQATLSATYQGVTGRDAVTVSSASIASISVTPATATIGVHATQAFSAVATLSDGSSLDATNYVTWLSSSGLLAGISNANGSQGVATGLAAGSVTITAVRGSTSGMAQLTVQ